MQFPPEKIVNVNLNHILDTTLLRALGVISSEDDIDTCFIDGRSIIPLMIKLKKREKEGSVVIHK